ncbi:MAG TPA: hypothetical protein VGG77_07855 [Roseiarcus sp.]|jgi:hypothetical protein
MIRITIGAETYAAIERTLPLGDVGVERDINDTAASGRSGLNAHRRQAQASARPGRGFSDVILRLAGEAKSR